MQNETKLSMSCVSSFVPVKDPQIKEINGELYILDSKGNSDELYDAFEHPELIQEFIKLGKKLEKSKNKTALVKDWVKDWGLLQETEISPGVYGQSFSSFLKQAEDFKFTWFIYKIAVNRALDMLKIGYESLEEIGCLTDYSDDPLVNYQYNAMETVTFTIENHTKNGELIISHTERLPGKRSDDFQLTPAIMFDDLIDALYMHFFMALTENKKVCPVCDSPFTPERKDKKYCSDSCKSTEKSRRYRKRFENKHGKKYWETDEDPEFKRYNA
jgi:predicted nucleic acid-binding Zn ribbon protein